TYDPVGTPTEIKDKLDLDQNGSPVDATKYRSMIGALMYLTSSRLDIVHATCLCARYQAKPTEKHLKEVKRIFYYLRGTINIGIWYRKDFGFGLTGFLDADYAGCIDTFKSTFGGAQFLGEKLVSCSSKKQDCTVLSTMEAKYVCLFACCAQVIWMQTQLTDYDYHFNNIRIYCDSKSAIAISCNPVQHSRIKHIIVRYHFIKEHVEKGTIELYFVKTDYQLAYLFTKALLVDRFNYLVCRLGMRSLSPTELERLAKSCPCAPKCHNCNNIGHFARDCRVTVNTNNAKNQRGTELGQKPTCYKCGVKGHYKRECPKLKNNNQGNQGGRNNASARVYAFGRAGADPDTNIITGTFLLNNRYASILFDTGADRSFMSTAFSSLIDIVPTPFGNSYDVELADENGLHFKFLKPSVQHRSNAHGTG
nr:copia protein [Tanacetum cinerariifolium]